MERVSFTEIEQVITENPELHVSKALKAIERNNSELSSIFDIIKDNKKILDLVDRDYFPQKVENLSDRHFEYDPSCDMSIYYLLGWGSRLLKYYNKKINKYLKLKEQYESALFSENYSVAKDAVNDISLEFGVSEWIYSQRFTLNSLSGDNTTCEEIENLKKTVIPNDLLKILLVYYEKMSNSNISYEDYCQSVEKILEKEGRKSIRGRYLNYKLCISESNSIQEFKSALIIDEQISLIDYYETFIDVLQNLYNKSRMIHFVIDIIYKLQLVIDDYRIRNMYIALGGNAEDNQIDIEINRNIEKYTVGDYSGLITEYNKVLKLSRVDFDLYNIFLKSGIDIGVMEAPHKDLWKEIYRIYNLQYKYIDCINKIGEFYKIFYNTSWKYKLCGILSRKLAHVENENILILCVINDYYLTPLFFQAILKDEDRIKYLNTFSYIAPNTIYLHKYVLTGQKNLTVENTIDPIRVNYYTIRRKMKEENYTECIDLCRRFLTDISKDNRKMYYQERIRRTLFSNYILKKMWIEAMHLYVESYLMAKELSIRMPLDILVHAIVNASEYEDDIRFDICKAIILRLYYKEDDKEVISAYMDYLDGQSCKTIIEYIDTNCNLNKYEIFFLYNVCTESLLVRDYVSTSLIHGTAIDLRIQILRTLIKNDKENEKRYFEELNCLYKEIQLQDKHEAFNHNRIFIDKTKLINYLSTTINKEFIEYSKVQEIRNLYNECGNRKYESNFGYENTYQFFYEIIEKIKQAYLFDSPYSLEDFLSTRIRHVFCKDSLKKVFEEQTLFAKKLKDSSEDYVFNEYWHKKLKKEDYDIIIKALSGFSKRIDVKIQEIRDTWIRIKKGNNGEGMFDYSNFTKNFLDYKELDLSKVLDSEEEFYNYVINELDERTNKILDNVRNRINKELKPYYRKAILDLEKDIRAAKITSNCKSELLRKIEITKAKYTEDIAKFEDIFYMKSEQYPDFTIKDVIEFCCEIEKDINPQFNSADFQIDNQCSSIYNGSIFPYMVDIVSILIHNTVEHSQLEDMSLLHIKVLVSPINHQCNGIRYVDERLKDYSVILNFRNNLSPNVNQKVLNEKVLNIISNMETNTFREKSKLTKGSGLYKIARTLYYSLDIRGAFRFEEEKGWFNFSVAMDLSRYMKKELAESV